MSELSQETITFGKYSGMTLARLLRDRSYCAWLVEQDWFKTNYEFLYNRIREHDPSMYFFKHREYSTSDETDENFLETYRYFNLVHPTDVGIDLSVSDKLCYEFYYNMIESLKQKIYDRIEAEEDNPYDIKAPTGWLKTFENTQKIPREQLKEFLAAYDLINIPYIIERIKAVGGIEYKGAKTFKIAKERSRDQETWWEEILKKKYGENIGTQFKYQKCIFDFIDITSGTIYECKLGLKDFNEEQHAKYKTVLNKYKILYLIAKDCVIDLQACVIRTLNPDAYQEYIDKIPDLKESSYLDELISDFELVKVELIDDAV